MAATTPRRPVAPGMIIGCAALSELLLRPPEVAVPSRDSGSVAGSQVYSPLMTRLLSASSKASQEMLAVDCRLKAPRTSPSSGRSTL